MLTISLILKAGGYGLVTTLASDILVKMGQPYLAKLLHIAAWVLLGWFSIKLLFDEAQRILNMWGAY